MHFSLVQSVYGIHILYWPGWCETYQKQPPRAVPRESCSENMQQIYRRTRMPKCHFNKVASQLYWNRTSACLFSCKFAAYFQHTFSSEHLWKAGSFVIIMIYGNIIEISGTQIENEISSFRIKKKNRLNIHSKV